MLQTCLSAPADRAGDNCRRDCFGRVHMHLEANLGRDTGALDQLAKATDCERCTPLGNESEGRFSTRSARNSSPISPSSWRVALSVTN